jgi:hypothetical protein
MPKRITSFLSTIFASLVAQLITLTMLPSSGVFAADDCLAEPKLQAGESGHWYFHTDRTTNRKCWYLDHRGIDVSHGASPAPTPGPRVAEFTTTPAEKIQEKRPDQRAAILDQAGRDALFQEFMRWQDRTGNNNKIVRP